MKWISVKDELPKKKGEYLVYVEEFNSETFNGFSHYVSLTNYEKRITKTIEENDGITHLLSKEMDFLINEYDRDVKVIFWMAIPKPSKENENERKSN